VTLTMPIMGNFAMRRQRLTWYSLHVS